MPGRHHQTGRAQSSGRTPRKPRQEVRWLSRHSGEALTAWGTVLVVAGGIVTVFTPWGYLLITIAVIAGAIGLDMQA